jgi:hypothetical protein
MNNPTKSKDLTDAEVRRHLKRGAYIAKHWNGQYALWNVQDRNTKKSRAYWGYNKYRVSYHFRPRRSYYISKEQLTRMISAGNVVPNSNNHYVWDPY